MNADSNFRWIATCARGLEPVVAAELAASGLAAGAVTVGGVAFEGPWRDGLRANWRLRAANRVLFELGSWPAADGEAIYSGAGRLASDPRLEELFRPERTFAVEATTSRSALRDTRWIALRVKDAVADAQRRRWGRRADVARRDPDLALRLRLHEDRATLLVDTSGDPLDRRGYRVAPTAAPVREQIAAAAVLVAGWDGRGPVVDPMCGSGTLLAEAGAIARGLPPQRLRRRWAFERLPAHDPAIFDEVRREPFPCPDPGARLYGVDRDPGSVEACRRNLEAAGLGAASVVSVGDAFDFVPPTPPGLLVINPPYGERLAGEADEWPRLGDLLKRRYGGWKAVVLAGGAGFGKHLGLKPARRVPFWNGPLEGRILVLDLW